MTKINKNYRLALLSLNLCATLALDAVSAAESAVPDFSGVWRHTRGTAPGLRGSGAVVPPSAGAATQAATQSSQGPAGRSTSGPPPAGNGNGAAGAGGSGEYLRAFSYQADGSPPPLQPWAANVLKEHTDALANGAQLAASVQQCLPPGNPVFMVQPYPYQIIQGKDVIVMISEANMEVRLIHMDRPHLPNLKPSWYGDSVGHWEGDTLVIDTIGQNNKTQISAYGIPKSEALHLVERYRLVNEGQRLEIRVQFDDPGVFTRPWEGIWTLDRSKDALIEYICAENEKDAKHMKPGAGNAPSGKP